MLPGEASTGMEEAGQAGKKGSRAEAAGQCSRRELQAALEGSFGVGVDLT